MQTKIDKPLLINLYRNGLSQINLAKMFGLSKARISKVVHQNFTEEEIKSITKEARLKLKQYKDEYHKNLKEIAKRKRQIVSGNRPDEI